MAAFNLGGRNRQSHFISALVRRSAERAASSMVESLESRRLLAAVSWDGGAGTLEWTDAANWSNNALPTASDDVTINIAGTPTVTISSGTQAIKSLTSLEHLSVASDLDVGQASTISGNLTLTGTLAGAGALTVNGSFTWASGTVAGNQTLQINGASDLTPTDGATIFSEQAHIVLAGNAIFNGGSAVMYGGGTATLEVAAGATLTLHGDTQIITNDGTPKLVNNGTLKTDVAGSIDQVGVAVMGTGSFNVAAGTLNLAAGTPGNVAGNPLSGSATIASGGRLALTAGTFEIGALTSSGAGTLAMTDFANCDFNAVATLGSAVEQAGNATVGGSGAVTINGAFAWAGGSVRGTGTTRVNGTASLTPASGNVLFYTESRHLTFAGNTTQYGSDGYVTGGETAVLEVAVGGTYTFYGDTLVSVNDGTPSFVNNGIVKTTLSNSVSVLNSFVSGSGAFNLTAGTLKLGTGTVSYIVPSDPLTAAKELTGSISVAAGAALTFESGTFDVMSITSSGAGTVAVEGSATVNFHGTSTLGTQLVFDGGSSIGGEGSVTENGAFTWTGGGFYGSGTTRFNSSASITAADNTIFFTDTHHLTFAGATVLNPAMNGWDVRGGGTAILEVALGGSLKLHGDSAIIINDGTPSLLNNGRIGTDVDGTVGNIAVPIYGTGTFDVTAGTLRLSSGTPDNGAGSALAGTATLASNAMLEFSTGTFNVGAFIDSGAGTLQIDGTAEVDFNAAATLQATLSVTGGKLAGSGRVEVVNSLEWHAGTIGGSGTLVSDTHANITPTLQYIFFTDTRHITLRGVGYLLDNTLGVLGGGTAVLEVASDGQLIAGGNVSVNDGTPELLVSGRLVTGVMNINMRLENHGVIDCGTLSVLGSTNAGEGGFLSGGEYDVTSGSTLTFARPLSTLTAHLVIALSYNAHVNGIDNLVTNNGEIDVYGGAFGTTLNLQPTGGTFHQNGIIYVDSKAIVHVTGDVVFGGANEPLLRTGYDATGACGVLSATGTIQCSSAGSHSRLDPESQTQSPAADPAVGTTFRPVEADGGIASGFNGFLGDVTPSGNSMRYAYTPNGQYVSFSIVAGPPPAAPQVLSMTYEYQTRQAITIQFDQDVSTFFQSLDLRFQNLAATDGFYTYIIVPLVYDPATNKATIVFSNRLLDGNYRAYISAGDIANSAGVTGTQSPSVNFFSLKGDTNHDRKVNFDDLLILAQHYGQPSGNTLATGNVDYSSDGAVDFADLLLLAQQYGKTLTTPAPLIALRAPQPFEPVSKRRGELAADVLA